MPTSPHPLESLLGPLRYAASRDFANLRSLKDLRSPLGAAITRARASLAADRLGALEKALGIIDSSDEQVRRRAVLAVLAVLRDEGLTVDFASVPATSVALPMPAPVSRPAPTRPVVEPPPKVPAKTAKAVKAPSAPKAKRAKKPKGDGPEAEATRILSIAPASGPLATLLKQVGWRLNPRLVGLLNKKGLTKVGDVLFLLPRVYDDRRQLKKIAQLRSGERGTVAVQVRHVEESSGRGRRQFRAVLADSSGTIDRKASCRERVSSPV